MDKRAEKALFKRGVTFDIDLYNTFIGLGFALGNVIACKYKCGFAFELGEEYEDSDWKTQHRICRYYYTIETDNVVVVRYWKFNRRFDIIVQPRSDRCCIFHATPISFPLDSMSEYDYLIQFAKSYKFISKTEDAVRALATIGYECAKGINDFADANSLFCFTHRCNEEFLLMFKKNRYDYDLSISRHFSTVEPFQIFKVEDHIIEYKGEDGKTHQFTGCRISFDINFALSLIPDKVN